MSLADKTDAEIYRLFARAVDRQADFLDQATKFASEILRGTADSFRRTADEKEGPDKEPADAENPSQSEAV